MPTLRHLRVLAITRSLFDPTTLRAATAKLGFVQADPIRSPATAQDLILRHRVAGYRAGDLERRYAAIGLEEDTLYAYGFLPRTSLALLHPRKARRLSKLEQRVLETVESIGHTHPRALDVHFPHERVVNVWGGYSKATTQALDALHYRGLLRIARRENGIRVYELAPPLSPLAPRERLRRLILVIANVLAPVPARTLRANIARYKTLGDPRQALSELVAAGELESHTIDGVNYLYPHEASMEEEAPARVRFLAPFDPVAWDRRRFEHLWGWQYRFEAYTPIAERVRGYYAMPVLWRDRMIGWANAGVKDRRLDVALGFVEKRPSGATFRSALDAEIAHLESFLRLV
jgi:uncharacterized protein